MSSNTATFPKHPAAEIAWLGPMLLDRYFTVEEFREISERYPDLLVEREKNTN